MVRKILLLVMLSIVFTAVIGCTPKSDHNANLFTTKKNVTITLEESMTVYQKMDQQGGIIGKANPGEYKVLDVFNTEKEDKTWLKIEFNGEEGYIYGYLFGKK